MKVILVVLLGLSTLSTQAIEQPPLPPVDLALQVLDDAGAPVADAEVACVRWFFADPPRTDPLRDDERTKTDSAGKCAFKGLTADEYAVFVFHGDLSALQRVTPRTLNGAAFELKLAPNPPFDIQLRDLHGQPLPDVLVLHDKCVPLAYSDKDGRVHFPSIFQPWVSFVKPGFGYTRSDFNPNQLEVFMAPGAILELTVVDEQGSPVPGAKVQYECEAVTDAEGKLRTIELPRYTKFRFKATAGDLAGEPVINIGSEPVQHSQIQLKKAPAKKPAQSKVYPGAPYPDGNIMLAAVDSSDPLLLAAANAQVETESYISGKVVMADTGKPAQARLYTDTQGDRYGLDLRGRTEPDGTFRIERSKLDTYLLVLPQDGRYYAVESPILLSPNASMENLVFTVKPGCSIRGHVVDTEGKPAYANVMLTSPVFVTVFSDERGYFSITHLPPVSDKYVLQAESIKCEVPAALPGTIISDIVITVPAKPKPPEGSTVEGVVVDPQGTPLGGLDVRFMQETVQMAEQTITDSRGKFSLKFKAAGSASVKVYRNFAVQFGNFSWGDLQEYTVREGSQVDVATDAPQQIRIVVDVPPLEIPLVVCWAEDEAGKPVQAKLQAYGDQSSPGVQDCGDSYLVNGFERVKQCLLELTAEGYQARVLELDKDFKVGDRSLRVVMKKGPYGENESIWTALTGRPDPYKQKPGVGDVLLPEESFYERTIRQNLAQYERLAGRQGAKVEAAEEEKRRGPQAPPEVDILAVDPQGKPVTEITCRAASMHGAYDTYAISQQNAVEVPDSPKRLLSDPNGRYRVPSISLVSAQGCAPRLVAVKPGEKYEPPLTVTLGPPASFTVTVLSAEGKPVPGAIVVPLEEMWLYISGNVQQRPPKTGPDGKIRIEALPAGHYVYAVALDQQGRGEVAVANLKWGENLETAVKVTAQPQAGSVEAMLVEWREYLYQPERIDKAVAALEKSQKRKLESAVLDQLRQIPVVVRMNTPQVFVLARVSAALELRKAIKPLQALFPNATYENPGVTVWFGGGTEAIMDALVRLGGDKMTDYFESVARNPEVLPQARTQAIIALGRIGADNSVAAFKRLRDAAYGKNGAPEPRATYTYGERLAETAAMTLIYIPGATGGPAIPLTGEGAWISADYSEGQISYMHYRLHFKRFGDEWLLQRMESMPVP